MFNGREPCGQSYKHDSRVVIYPRGGFIRLAKGLVVMGEDSHSIDHGF